jgi:hypothetical protein
VRGESGAFGDQDIAAAGFRALGLLPARFDYNVEVALERGHSGGDDVHAWAGHWQLAHRLWAEDRAPRLVAEYNYATGDQRRGDGRLGTFDHLFPTNHNKYGTADQIGWRNMGDMMGGLDWRPNKEWRAQLDYHAFYLATVQDGLYTNGGGLVLRNPSATSRHVGNEIDLQVSYRRPPHWQLGVGIAHLFPGEYWKQSSRGSAVTAPYVFLTFAF